MLFLHAYGVSHNADYYLPNQDHSNTANLTVVYYDVNGNLTCILTQSLRPLAAKAVSVADLATTCPQSNFSRRPCRNDKRRSLDGHWDW